MTFMTNSNFTDRDLGNMYGSMLARSMRIASGGDPDGQAIRSLIPSADPSAFASDPYVLSTTDPAERQKRMDQVAKFHNDTMMKNAALAGQRSALSDLTKPSYMQ